MGSWLTLLQSRFMHVCLALRITLKLRACVSLFQFLALDTGKGWILQATMMDLPACLLRVLREMRKACLIAKRQIAQGIRGNVYLQSLSFFAHLAALEPFNEIPKPIVMLEALALSKVLGATVIATDLATRTSLNLVSTMSVLPRTLSPQRKFRAGAPHCMAFI
mmetsp:Transcript_6918/g.12784  ORF Transcript_6918/g.12784 Transcript_6918/m.12784 type:complete len:164 (+) Transcript_6918:2626-3117(+)